ncbi:MAG TPA: hypothetical protein VI612_02210 [Candidatus Nanoarchaeia archaeon]|nr:hypothetical protein [Candidatus Nanoarchaeia archaeon]
MKSTLILVLLLLIACTQTQIPQEQQQTTPQEAPQAPEIIQLGNELPTRTVKQTSSKGTTVYGLSEDNRLLRVEKDVIWEYVYQDGTLNEIKGPENIEFLNERNKLSAIDRGFTKLRFLYDSRGRIVELAGSEPNLHFDYDSLDLLRGIRRGVAGKTSLDYDKQYKIKYITRGQITTNVFYDDKNRVRNFDADDVKFILGYWRDDKLISLSGKTFGQGLTVSYGPDDNPNEAKFVAEFDDSTFTSAYKDALYSVVDKYLYCKYVRRLPDLIFDGISYTFYVNYFKGDMPGYIAQQFACTPIQ